MGVLRLLIIVERCVAVSGDQVSVESMWVFLGYCSLLRGALN